MIRIEGNDFIDVFYCLLFSMVASNFKVRKYGWFSLALIFAAPSGCSLSKKFKLVSFKSYFFEALCFESCTRLESEEEKK